MHVPEPLYKYTTYDAAISILSTGRLRWSSPLLFNDLTEFQRMPRFEPSLDQSLASFPRALVEIALGERQIDNTKLSHLSRVTLAMVHALLESGMERQRVIEELTQESKGADSKMDTVLRTAFENFGLNTARVCCLTTEFDNDVMWAHYSENHKGVVLGFRHLPDLDTPFLAAQPVRYLQEPSVIGSGLDFLLYGDSPELRIRALKSVCLTKSTKWQYENEWRVFTWRPEEVGRNYGDYKFYPDELESVCFGARIEPEREEEIRSLVHNKYARCSLFRMVVNHGDSRRELAL
ncbi:MAG: DUF2971 domain-containing protein [Sulfuricaulis sp.]